MNKTLQFAKRDLKIDRMRFICMIFIMMAHTIPSDYFMQVRAFDVVCLVFISSLCTKEITTLGEYRGYLYKRFKKLLFPIWMLISLILIVTFILDVAFSQSYTYSLKTVILSYTLIDGIGYVWIVRILLILAAVMPVLQVINKKLKDRYFTIVALLMIVSTDVIFLFSRGQHSVVLYLIEFLVIPTIGYSSIALIAQKIGRIEIKKCIVLTIVSFVFVAFILLIMFFNQDSLKITFYKYPPRTIYLLYGLFMTWLLYCIIPSRQISGTMSFIDKFTFYVSSKSFGVYFAHIVLVKVTQYLIKLDFEVANSYGLAVINILGSIFLVYLVEKLKMIIKKGV